MGYEFVKPPKKGLKICTELLINLDGNFGLLFFLYFSFFFFVAVPVTFTLLIYESASEIQS